MAKNFGFNIGGGGIADLVAAPKVNPIRSGQFAPTPQLRRDTKKPKKQITGALLGAASPFLAEAGIEALGKIPGLGSLLYDESQQGFDPATLGTEAGTAKPVIRDGTSLAVDPVAQERGRLRAAVDAALPISSSMLPKKKSLLGSGLSQLLSYAPGLALGDEDDGSAAAFISAAQASKKLSSALDETKLDNYLKRQTARGTALSKDIDLDRLITYGAYLDPETNKVVPLKRDVLVSKDGSQRYVVSQQDPKVDKYTDENGKTTVIPAGQAYINRNLSLDDADIPASQKVNFVNTNDRSERAIGTFYPAVMKPDGTRGPLFVIEDPEGGPARVLEDWKTLGKNWILDTPGIEKDPRLSKGKGEVGDLFSDLDLAYGALNSTLNSANVVLQLAQDAEEGGDSLQAFTKTGQFLNKAASSLNLELDSFNRFLSDLGTSSNEIIRGRLAPKASGNVMAVFAAANNHARAYANYDPNDPQATITPEMENADNQLIAALNRLEQSTAGQVRRSTDGSVFSFGNRDKITNNVVQRGRLIAAQIRLAYSAAASEGQTGRTLSDKDVANFLEQVGFESNNPKDVGTRTAEFVATSIRNLDDRSATFADLKRLSKSTDPADEIELNQRIGDLVRIDPEKLNKLTERNSDGSYVLSDEEARKLQSEIKTDISRVSTLATPYFLYDPKTRRFIYKSYERSFRDRALSDPIINNFMKYGGYFVTLDVDKNTFIYDFVGSGRRAQAPTSNATGGYNLDALKNRAAKGTTPAPASTAP